MTTKEFYRLPNGALHICELDGHYSYKEAVLAVHSALPDSRLTTVLVAYDGDAQ